MKVISFKVEARCKATCESCGGIVLPSATGLFEVSPHLRVAHEFTAAPIDFHLVSEVICPPMQFIEARQ